MKKEFDLYTKEDIKVINVKRINVHSFSMKGYEGTPYANLFKRVSYDELKQYKERLSLVTYEENSRRKERKRQLNETVMELLVKANFNINVHTGSLHEDERNEALGKHQLKKVVELLTDGKELTDKVAK